MSFIWVILLVASTCLSDLVPYDSCPSYALGFDENRIIQIESKTGVKIKGLSPVSGTSGSCMSFDRYNGVWISIGKGSNEITVLGDERTSKTLKILSEDALMPRACVCFTTVHYSVLFVHQSRDVNYLIDLSSLDEATTLPATRVKFELPYLAMNATFLPEHDSVAMFSRRSRIASHSVCVIELTPARDDVTLTNEIELKAVDGFPTYFDIIGAHAYSEKANTSRSPVIALYLRYRDITLRRLLDMSSFSTISQVGVDKISEGPVDLASCSGSIGKVPQSIYEPSKAPVVPVETHSLGEEKKRAATASKTLSDKPVGPVSTPAAVNTPFTRHITLNKREAVSPLELLVQDSSTAKPPTTRYAVTNPFADSAPGDAAINELLSDGHGFSQFASAPKARQVPSQPAPAQNNYPVEEVTPPLLSKEAIQHQDIQLRERNDKCPVTLVLAAKGLVRLESCPLHHDMITSLVYPKDLIPFGVIASETRHTLVGWVNGTSSMFDITVSGSDIGDLRYLNSKNSEFEIEPVSILAGCLQNTLADTRESVQGIGLLKSDDSNMSDTVALFHYNGHHIDVRTLGAKLPLKCHFLFMDQTNNELYTIIKYEHEEVARYITFKVQEDKLEPYRFRETVGVPMGHVVGMQQTADHFVMHLKEDNEQQRGQERGRRFASYHSVTLDSEMAVVHSTSIPFSRIGEPFHATSGPPTALSLVADGNSPVEVKPPTEAPDVDTMWPLEQLVLQKVQGSDGGPAPETPSIGSGLGRIWDMGLTAVGITT